MLTRTKPAASVTTMEAIIMWSNNQTSKWLDSLTPDEHDRVLAEARTMAPEIKHKLKERQQRLFETKLENLRQRQEKKAHHEEKNIANKVKLTQKNN